MIKGFKLIIFLVFFSTSFFFFRSLTYAETWSTPQQISNSTEETAYPATATGPNGYLHTIWAEYSSTTGDPTSVFYSFWNGDTWSAPTRIDQNLGWADLPWIATSGTVNSYKVHTVWDGGTVFEDTRVYYKSYDSTTSSWSSPVNLLQSLDIPGSCAWDPRIVSDSTGNLHATFEYQTVCNDSDSGVRLYYTKFNGSTWSEPYRLTIKGTEADRIWLAAIALDTSNNPHVIIPESGNTDSDPQAGVYETYWNGSSWTVPQKLLNYDSWDKIFVRLVIDSNNNRHLAYTNETLWDTTSQSYRNKVNYKKYNGSTWSSPVTISSSATYSSWSNAIFGVTFDSNNNVYVGWGEKVGWEGDPAHGVQVSYKKSSDGASWSSPIFMRYVYELDNPFLYRDKWDNQHFAWTEQDQPTGKWTLWYSTVPINIQTYNPANAFTMTLGTTTDTLTIPTASYATSVSVSAQIGPLPASFNPLLTSLPRSYTFRPHGLTFVGGNKVAKATIYYADNEVIGSDERNMKIYVWNGQSGSWDTTFDTSVNTSQNKATVTLPHFSLYGVTAPKIQTNFASPATNSIQGTNIPLSYQLINLMTNLPADPPAARRILVSTDDEGIETWDENFWDEYEVELVNNQSQVVQTLNFNAGTGDLTYDTITNTYQGTFSGSIPEGDYLIKVYLAGTLVGTMNIHFTPTNEEPLPSVTFLPPLKSDEPYTMQDGSTLPFQFSLSENGTLLTTPQDVLVYIKGVNDNNFTSEPLLATFDPGNSKYQVILLTKALGMGIGEYTGEVFLGQNKLGSITFTILQEGKAKGKL